MDREISNLKIQNEVLSRDIFMYEKLLHSSRSLLYSVVDKPAILKAIIEDRIKILDTQVLPETMLDMYKQISDDDVINDSGEIRIALDYFEAKEYEELRDECDCGNHAEHDLQMNPENYNANGNELEKVPDWYGGGRADYDNYKNS